MLLQVPLGWAYGIYTLLQTWMLQQCSIYEAFLALSSWLAENPTFTYDFRWEVLKFINFTYDYSWEVLKCIKNIPNWVVILGSKVENLVFRA
jgi:hypothetical protein